MTETDTKPRAGLNQRIIDQIIAELERGVVPWHQPWSGASLSERITRPLRYNGEPYRGINIIALWMASTSFGFTSPFWMTYRQAKELGGQVRKGEKGSLVVFASSMTRRDKDAGEDAETREIHYMKGYTVFNVEQIDALPGNFAEVPPAPLLTAHQRDAKAEEFFTRLGADTRHGGNRAFYRRSDDFIQMPPFECFTDAASYYATRAHETVHWTSHQTRLDRSFDGNKRFGGGAYAMEELVAELGAAFLSIDLQVTPELRSDHAAYIENWLKVLKSDNCAIFTAAAHAQRACDWLHERQS